MPTNTRQVVVVGGGLAGLRTIEHLRRRGHDGTIVLISDEEHLPYDRPPLSKQILRGEREVSSLCSAEELQALGVTLRLREAAQALDRNRRTVQTSKGEVPFDAVVIATGSSPRRVRDLGGHVLRTIDHAHALRRRLRDARRIAVVGAGLIGCEVAASARALDIGVDLVDVESGPMIRVVGPRVAEHVAALHAERGVDLHLGTGLERSGADAYTTTDGKALDVDLVLEAVGSQPSTHWLVGSGLPAGDGVACDEHGRTADGVYAVGDVARWDGVRHEHWTSAAAQAECVAAVILGQLAPAAPLPYWWSDQYEVKIQGLGTIGRSDDVEVLEWGPNRRLVALYSDAGRLTAVVGFSAAGAIMRLRNQIVGGAPVGEVQELLSR